MSVLGQTQHALADDVGLDLAGPAANGGREGVEVAARPAPAVHVDPAKLAAPVSINIELTDRKEMIGIEAGKSVLLARVGSPSASPAVTLKGPRRLILGLLFLKLPLAQLQAAGLTVEGDASVVAALQAALDPVSGGFAIAEP